MMIDDIQYFFDIEEETISTASLIISAVNLIPRLLLIYLLYRFVSKKLNDPSYREKPIVIGILIVTLLCAVTGYPDFTLLAILIMAFFILSDAGAFTRPYFSSRYNIFGFVSIAIPAACIIYNIISYFNYKEELDTMMFDFIVTYIRISMIYHIADAVRLICFIFFLNQIREIINYLYSYDNN